MIQFILSLLAHIGELGYNVTFAIVTNFPADAGEGIRVFIEESNVFTIVVGTTAITVSGIAYSSFSALLSYTISFSALLLLTTGTLLSPFLASTASMLFLRENQAFYTRVYDPTLRPRRAQADPDGNPVYDPVTGSPVMNPNNHNTAAQDLYNNTIVPDPLAFRLDEDMGSNSDVESNNN